MTYAEIIKKLEIYSDGISGTHEDFDPGLQETCVNAINFINRQKAEIEQLTKDKENLAYSLANAVGRKMTAKAEAYKEVWQKLKKEMLVCGQVDVDDFFERLVGENDAKEKAKE